MKQWMCVRLSTVVALVLVAGLGCSSKSDPSPTDTVADTAQGDVQADQTVNPDVPQTDTPTPEDLQGEIPCQADCEGKACGDDGCGGQCGYCQVGFTCIENGTCEEDECVPNCTIKACGSDGCGGECGLCEGDSYCGPAFQCIPFDCTPDCFNKECGDDTCDGSCGECDPGSTCVDFLCVPDCVGSCAGKECGDDGCGGNCGQCAQNFSCNDTQKCTPAAECVATAQCIFACSDQGGTIPDCATTCYEGVPSETSDLVEAYGSCGAAQCGVPFATNFVTMQCLFTKCSMELSACIEYQWGVGSCADAVTCMSACEDDHLEACIYGCLPAISQSGFLDFLDMAACLEFNCPEVTDPTQCPECTPAMTLCMGF